MDREKTASGSSARQLSREKNARLSKKGRARRANTVRVRVWTRMGTGRKVPMIGLIPRAAMDDIRARLKQAMDAGEQRCRLSARVKRLEAVKLVLEDGSNTTVGRRILLGVRVREVPNQGKSRAQILREELEELVRDAEKIKNAETQQVTTA